MAMHFIVRFEPISGKEAEFRKELKRVLAPSKAEPGCVSIRAYESIREPLVFAIHSEWVDEAAFESHAARPHTIEFVEAATRLLTHPIHGLRSREI